MRFAPEFPRVAFTRFGMSFAMFLTLSSVPAQSAEKVLYSFQGGSGDGAGPAGGLIIDNGGNLYGTTAGGGGGNCRNSVGCGTIFKLAQDGTEIVLHAFAGGSDGAFPYSGLITDGAGDFYGTTSQGGGAGIYGTVFELDSDGMESVLYAFQGGGDGYGPSGNLVSDNKGHLFGTTVLGGDTNVTECGGNNGCGTVYELNANGSKTTLYAFQGASDGGEPAGGVIRDANGNLYGTTSIGGDGGANCPNGSLDCGTVFKIAPDGTETVLHSFKAGSDGYAPVAGLIMGAAGNLYGTTEGGGGAANCPFGSLGCGTVFKIAPDGSETVLYAFKGGSDGYVPRSALIVDKAGNLYGTTFAGGSTHCHRAGCGTVFKLAPDGTETILYAFTRAHGETPTAALLLKNGLLYGTATAGGASNDGVVFSVKK